ncbi:MAG: hypothetical protein NC418_03685 [Muribaculaceae bacterium]|nr:hypothetical protein [Muribaculaceae bacterium]
MAKTSENILDRARSRGLATPSAGMSVPEGYFEDFASRMAAMLPERPEIESAASAEASKPRTLWQQVRPYVYMAAMFAGVWCMLQMFASLSGAGKLQPMSENPVLAKALSSEQFVSDYLYNDLSSWDVVDEMMADGTIEGDDDIDALWLDDSILSDDSADYLLPK